MRIASESPAPIRLTAAIAAGMLALGLTACTAGEAEPQPRASVAAACAAVQEVVQQAVDEFQQIDPTDPRAAAAALTELARAVGDAAARVSDETISGILPRLRDALEQSADIMGEIADGNLGKTAELAGPAEEVQSAFADFAAHCG